MNAGPPPLKREPSPPPPPDRPPQPVSDLYSLVTSGWVHLS